jgi:hypothetical protein
LNISLPKENASIKNSQKRIFGVLLGILCLAYYSLLLNKVFPYTEGWYAFYDGLVKKGMTPYKDFYYYLPPLSLLIDHVFLALSHNSFVIYRVFRLIERVAIVLLVYHELTLFFSPLSSFVSSLAGALVGTCQIYMLMGDYNQTEILFVLCISLFATKFVMAPQVKDKCIDLGIAGIFFGLTFWLKQSTFVASVVVFFLALIVYCWINRDNNGLVYTASTLIGFAIPVTIGIVWLLLLRAFPQFVTQVYLQSGKGSLSSILVGGVFHFAKTNFVVFLIILLFVGYLLNKGKGNQAIFLFSAASLTYLQFRKYINPIIKITVKSGYVIPFALLVLFFGLLLKAKGHRRKKVIAGLFCASLVGFLIWLFANIGQSASLLHKKGYTFATDHVTSFVVLASLFLICFEVFNKAKFNHTNAWLMLCIGGLALCYQSCMASGSDYIVVRVNFLLLPPLVAFVVDALLNEASIRSRVWLIIGFAALVMECSICLSQKLENPYSWWGWEPTPLRDEIESVAIPELKGFKFSKEEQLLYNESMKIIEGNTTEKSRVFAFPHIQLFNVLSHRYTMDWFVPVLFYDVCSDEYARYAAECLAGNPPDLVVWCDMPGVMELHEKVFRDGDESGQREIHEWFRNVKDPLYDCVGQVGNLFFYKLKDNGVVSTYTYFEKPEKEISLNGLYPAYELGKPIVFPKRNSDREYFGLKSDGSTDAYIWWPSDKLDIRCWLKDAKANVPVEGEIFFSSEWAFQATVTVEIEGLDDMVFKVNQDNPVIHITLDCPENRILKCKVKIHNKKGYEQGRTYLRSIIFTQGNHR